MAWRPLLAAAAAFLALLASAPAPAQPPGETASRRGEIMREAGVAFPDRIGAFTLQRIGSVGPGRVGATYLSPGGALVDIFVAPAEVPLEREFADTEESIVRVFGPLRPLRDLAAPPSAPGALGRLWAVETGRGPAHTAAMVWQRRGWRIKLRGTVLAAAGDAGVAEIEGLIRAFDWD